MQWCSYTGHWPHHQSLFMAGAYAAAGAAAAPVLTQLKSFEVGHLATHLVKCIVANQ